MVMQKNSEAGGINVRILGRRHFWKVEEKEMNKGAKLVTLLSIS